MNTKEAKETGNEKVCCVCGWHGVVGDLLCDVLHEEAGRTIWVCPKCGRIV